MSLGRDRRVVGIVAESSTAFLQRVFERLGAGDVVVFLRREQDTERMELAGVKDVVVPSGGSGWVERLDYRKSDDDGVSQVVFSSGTEGKPKAVVLSHAAVANTTDRLLSVMGINSEIREYLGVPAFYSFGFARARVVSAAGGRLYLPPNGFDPIEIADMLARGELNAISAVPSLWRLVFQNKDLYLKHGNRVRWIEIGSQYMSAEEKLLIRSLFPEARIVQHYGLTEASRTTFLKLHEASGRELESVGQASDGVEVEIGPSGRVRIRGPHLASGILVGGEVQPLTDESGWLTTGDLGRIHDGFLYYEGRADDQINCAGVKLSPEALERDLYADLGLSAGLGVSKAADELRGEVALIAHEERVDAQAVRSAAGKVLRLHGLEAGAVRLLRVKSMPVTETGKPQRRTLTEMYERERAKEVAGRAAEGGSLEPSAEPAAQAAAIVRVWEEVLQIRPVSIHDSFFDLGGDSLSAVSVATKMERLGVPSQISRQIFEGKSIAQIMERSHERSGERSTKTPLATASQAIDVARGMLVLCVIATHWMPGLLNRLPDFLALYNSYLSPFYSAGTPGFAIVFGIGVGFVYLPRFLRSPQSVRALAFRNAMLLGAGITCIAALRISVEWARGNPMTPVDVSNAFWGALTYYFVAMISIPVWLRLLSRHEQHLWIACLSAALLLYLVHLALEADPPGPSSNPFVQTGILLAYAKFNYFEMTAGVMLGIAAGHWLRLLVTEGGLARLWQVGALVMIFSFVLSVELGQRSLWLTWPKPLYLWMWFCYGGAVLLIVAVVYKAISKPGAWRALDGLWKILAIVGILAFPLYIGHELVIPFKDLLQVFRVPGALAISLLVFFAVVGYLMFRLHRVYYSDTPAPDADSPLTELLADRKLD